MAERRHSRAGGNPEKAIADYIILETALREQAPGTSTWKETKRRAPARRVRTAWKLTSGFLNSASTSVSARCSSSGHAASKSPAGASRSRRQPVHHGVIPASRGGKVKTALQILAIAWYLLPLSEPLARVGAWVMWIAVVVTVGTGADYVMRAARLRRRVKELGR